MFQGLRSRQLAGMFVLVVIGTTWFGLARADEEVPANVKKGIEAALQKKVADLAAMKDPEGVPYKRGTFSKSFRKVDDKTYEVTFHVDTAERDGKAFSKMKTERLLLTLQPDAGGAWAIKNEVVKDTIDDIKAIMVVGTPGRFDGMEFEREGLQAKSGPGWLIYMIHYGKIVGFRVIADDLSYDYKVPPDVLASYNYYDIVLQRLKKTQPDDLFFKPDYLEVYCDGATCDSLLGSAFKNASRPRLESGSVPGTEAAPSVPERVKKDLDELTSSDAELKKGNPFANMDEAPDPDHRYWLFKFTKTGGDPKSFLASYDNWEPWEIIVGTVRQGPIWGYNSQDVRKLKLSPYDLETREDSEARLYDVDMLHGTVDLALQDESTMRGDLTFGLTIKQETRTVPFRISRAPNVNPAGGSAPKLFIDSIQDEQGNELTYSRLAPGPVEKPLLFFSPRFANYLSSHYILVFPKPVQAGTKVKLRMQFTNQDAIAKYNPSFLQPNRTGWLPFVRFTDPIEDFDLTVRVPDRFHALGIGRKASETRKDGIETSHWVSKSAVSFPTIIFGEYLEDTPGFKAKKLDGTEIPVKVSVDKMASNDIDLGCIERGTCTEREFDNIIETYNSGARGIRQSQLRAVADQAANALNLYAAIYGIDYPFDKLDLVNDPQGSFYGQAPASIIYLGWTAFRGEGAIASGNPLMGRFLNAAGITKFNKDVVAHETAHQWWGSLINNANDRNYWFVESLAEYSSALFVENVYGKKRYLDKVADWRREILANDMLSSVQNASVLYSGGGFGNYRASVYAKGPYAFHVLRETFGDEKFFAFLKKLANGLAHKQIVTRDIQQVMEESFGGSMEWFFDQWLRGIGLPQYAVNYTTRKTEDGQWLVEGSIKQRVLCGKDKAVIPNVYYRAVAPLKIVFQSGEETTTKPRIIEGPETKFQMKLPKEPKVVLFNADGQILAHDVLYNQSW